MGFFFFSHFSLNLVIFLTLFAFSLADNEQFPPVTLKGVSIERPVLDVSPSLLLGQSNIRCERFQVSGISRFKLGSYANSLHVTLAPSFLIPKRLHNKINLCFHRNNTLGWCQCENNEWRGLHKWIWSAVMSPYETRYVDVKIDGEIPGSVTVALDEDFQQLRLISLAIGLTLMLLAPIISSWVPFYYGSSMAIGIFLVVIIILFQLGAELLLLHQYSMIVNSILQSFGMSEEMLNLVALSVLLGIILAGAALGYWTVRRFVISKEDGSVDAGVGQFVKWGMRVTGAALGIFLVVIIILFQLRAELLLLHQFSMIVNSILQSFGMSEEILNLVALSVLLGIILAGAALGYWTVRRFVISKEDGSVDAGVGQFVKWGMRVTGAALGIFLVVIIILFQLRAELLLLHQFSMIVNSILQSFGMSEEILNLVALSVLLGIILAGAAIGYWNVRRFVISKEDGSVDAGVAQFVKWAMRVTGATFVLQSTIDTPLAIGALVSCGAVCKLISSIKLLHGCNGKKVTKEEWDGFMRNSIEQALAERAKSSEVNN